MPRKLGTCSSCRHPIYDIEGPGDACGCDEGVLTTLQLREGTPVTARPGGRRANQNGDILPDLDITMFLSPSARAELQGAQAVVTSHRVEFPPGSPIEVEEVSTDWASGLDIEFDSGEDIEIPTAPADRPGRFRVDRGAPQREAFQGRVAGGPSDGNVVGRVGNGLGRPQPIYVIGREAPVDYIPGRTTGTLEVTRVRGAEDRAAWQQLETAHRGFMEQSRQAAEARVVATTRPAGTRPVESRPVDRSKIPTAFERLGKVDFDDDPFG